MAYRTLQPRAYAFTPLECYLHGEFGKYEIGKKNSEIMELHNCYSIENVLSLHPECSVSIHYEGRSDSVNVCSSKNVI